MNLSYSTIDSKKYSTIQFDPKLLEELKKEDETGNI